MPGTVWLSPHLFTYRTRDEFRLHPGSLRPDRTNYYNANWGYQNGDKRNARVRNSHEPKIILSHYWTLDEKHNYLIPGVFIWENSTTP
jgi:hypothetical protein